MTKNKYKFQKLPIIKYWTMGMNEEVMVVKKEKL